MNNGLLKRTSRTMIYLAGFAIALLALYFTLDSIRVWISIKDTHVNIVLTTLLFLFEVLMLILMTIRFRTWDIFLSNVDNFAQLKNLQIALHGILLGLSLVFIHGILWELTSLLEYLMVR